MRLLERLILSRIREHLDSHNIIINNQSGFRATRQTKDNLFHLFQKASENFHRGSKTLCIFFDIEKAFDKMWHDGLLLKLHKINLPYYLIRFIENFLSNREFFVQVGDAKTPKFMIYCGCPQGAVLSPTLFLIYINDVPIRNMRNSEYTALFADDIVFYIFYKKLSKAFIKKIQNYLDSLENWANHWRLTFAPHKCNYTILTKIGTSDDKKNIAISMYDKEIKYDPSPRFLGIVIDENLKFESHVNTIRANAIGRLNVLKILTYSKWNIHLNTRLAVYKSLIRSLVDYCAFLYPIMSKSAQDKLQILQNDALRIVLRKGFNVQTDKNERISSLHRVAGKFKQSKNGVNACNTKTTSPQAIVDCNPLISATPLMNLNILLVEDSLAKRLFYSIKPQFSDILLW
jgi:hypothetical protein